MRTTRSITLVVAIAAVIGLATPRAAVTQPVSLTPGARLRVTAPDFDIKDRKGTLVRATPDSLTIDFRRTPPLTLPIHGLSRLDVSTGKRPGAGLVRGAGLGFLIGALVGIGIAAGLESSCREGGGDVDDCGAFSFFLLGTYGAGAGLIVGGVIGVATAPDRWEEVSLRREASGLGQARPGSSIRVGLTIPFLSAP